ncbi:DNA alkylation repair protein [Pseudoduganella sp. SL102]|uniref:DNA alkylation repair protein n=1 Tax=Pseudoduganella sp. SL102 TaxID=2995154 RepID=UPI00248BCF16|nr:DNA alkylation repair protein [Pseudoduganella sp. SL102]WBS05338.1 DNA alkylation repair protein [Pseudoduganella sp. SL102]
MTAKVWATVRDVIDGLAPLADEGLASEMSAYQRGQFAFLGIPAVPRRAAVGKPGSGLSGEEALQVAARLWDLPGREYKYTAADVLLQAAGRLDGTALDPLLDLAQREPWWDTVDPLATVIGTVVRRRRGVEPGVCEAMDAASAHPSPWVRRIAMIHQRGWRLDTDEARLFRYALALAGEPDFFIRKAIGWALRDYGRWNPPAVTAFLATHGARFSPLTVREARKHLPPVTS